MIMTQAEQEVLRKITATHSEQPIGIVVGGSRLFGLAHAESDWDIYGIHGAPTTAYLGLTSPQQTIHREFPTPKSEFTSHELGKFCALLLKGNPSAFEILYSPYQILTTSVYHDLQDLGHQLKTQQLAYHYRNIANAHTINLTTLDRKRLLHGLRAYLMGLFYLETTSLLFDLPTLLTYFEHYFGYDLTPWRTLLHNQTHGCPSESLSPQDYDVLLTTKNILETDLTAALAQSTLPQDVTPTLKNDVNTWLIQCRLAQLRAHTM